jgi:tetratricopeptide (TPR) repeat protein
MSLKSGDADTLNERARTYLAADRYDEALTDANAAIAAQATIPDYFITRAKVHEARSERDTAIADFSKALELDPGSKQAKGGLSRLGATP